MLKQIKPTDYTYMWWAYGLRNNSPEEKRIMCIQTGNYGMAVDVNKASLVNLGPIANPKNAEQAMSEDNNVIFSLPGSGISWELKTSKGIYRCTSAALQKDQTRIIESGRFVQRFDMEKMEFCNEQGDRLDTEGRLEIAALPEYFSVNMELDGLQEKDEIELKMELNLSSEWRNITWLDGMPSSGCACMTDNNGDGIIVAVPQTDTNEEKILQVSGGKICLAKKMKQPGVSGGNNTSIIIYPGKGLTAKMGRAFINPLEGGNIIAKGIEPYNEEAEGVYDSAKGWYRIGLPDHSKAWDMESNRDILERVSISITNPYDYPVRIPLLLAKDYGIAGVPGMSPMIRDEEGNPSGLPMQISKNWHQTKGKKFLYQGPWFHGFTIVEVEAGDTVNFEFDMAYANWGGVPAASHAQLCLVGWGTNQLWDQAAIGCFGESICYDPDVNLNRSMIDDVRPLMVWSMNAKDARTRWGWTNNVGGGDFLVYYNEKKEKQFLSRMRTYYKRYCPNLTEVHYSGVSADGNIAAHIRVSTPRCDDINRAYHRFRYDILKPAPFTRLAFYQVGADKYNNHLFNKLAIGNEAGVLEELQPAKGGLRYELKGFACEGEVPWFSLHDAVPGDYYGPDVRYPGGAWANRGLVVRSWKARLGGREIPYPYASVYLTEDYVGSANLEITPPAGMNELLPGDFVECEVELLILPMSGDDYYGPNQSLRNSLHAGGNTWRPVYRQAVGNNIRLSVGHGKMIQKYPVVIHVDDEQKAVFTLEGGLGYLPVTVSGLKSHKGWIFQQSKDGKWKSVNQEVHGKDYWQTDYNPDDCTWEITFNVLLDTPDDMRGASEFRLVFQEL